MRSRLDAGGAAPHPCAARPPAAAHPGNERRRSRHLLSSRPGLDREEPIGGRFHWLVWHGIFRATARKAPSANGAEVGPVSALPDEPARLREDAALSLPEVHSTE